MALIKPAVGIPVVGIQLHRLLIIAYGLRPLFHLLVADAHTKIHFRMMVNILHCLVLRKRLLILLRIPIKIPQYQMIDRHIRIYLNGPLYGICCLLDLLAVPKQKALLIYDFRYIFNITVPFFCFL